MVVRHQRVNGADEIPANSSSHGPPWVVVGGRGYTNVQNTNIHGGFVPVGFRFCGRKQYSGLLLKLGLEVTVIKLQRDTEYQDGVDGVSKVTYSTRMEREKWIRRGEENI